MKISAVIPTYNAVDYLAEAIWSALRQTRPPDEILVVDDGSTDETANVLRQFGPPVICIRQENRGLSAARNRGIHQAGGDWIALLDADDIWSPRKLEVQCATIARVPDAVLAYTAHSTLRAGKIVWTSEVPDEDQILQALRERCPFQPSSVLVRRDAVLEAGGFEESMRSGPEDWDLWIRLMRRGGRFAGISEPLLTYRQVPSGLSLKAESFLEGQSRFVRGHLNSDLPTLRRWIKTRRVVSRLESEAATVLREQGNSRYLRLILRSLRTWPVPLNWRDRRYKLAAHMLLTRCGELRAHNLTPG
jgi:glycosyltransferase involved in cell wall biosynthesis